MCVPATCEYMYVKYVFNPEENGQVHILRITMFSFSFSFSFSWFSIFAISTFSCSAGGRCTSQYPRHPAKGCGRSGPVSVVWSILPRRASHWCVVHTYFRRHARRATAGSENPARAMEASFALVRRALMEDLRDHYMINRRYDPSPEVINLSHSIGSLSTTQDHPCRPWPTFLRLNVLSQIAWTSVRIQAGSITINIY
jgi:hypothetical protein